MDCAKGVNFVLAGGGRMEDYWGFGKAKGELLPSIGVPCTAGTGSEAQSFALISRDRDHRKMACGDPRARFRTVLLDPRLATTAPRRVVALAGLDALSHGIEAFVTRTAQPLSRLLAREGAAAINGALATVLRDQGDLAAWSSMLFGAYLSGAAIEASMLGAAHALANPLTAHYSLGHGEAVALVLPAVVRWNGGLDDGRAYTEIAAALGLLESGESPSEALARRVSDLTVMAGLAAGLAVWGVEEAALPALAAEAAEQWTLRHNPRPATVGDLAALYRASL
jgi:alcohol dehydrogenase